jgi:hypothetical protein
LDLLAFSLGFSDVLQMLPGNGSSKKKHFFLIIVVANAVYIFRFLLSFNGFHCFNYAATLTWSRPWEWWGLASCISWLDTGISTTQ